MIRRLVDERPTYGRRRVTALLNRARRAEGLDPVNRKRVLRILRENGLVSARHTRQRPDHTYKIVVFALRYNFRRRSDHLELHCRNSDVVRVLFVLDACDREIIAFSAVAHAGVCGEMVRDLMVEAFERRFGRARTPHPVERLSGNRSAYFAKEIAGIATALGLRLAFTPVRSPESNGMTEGFFRMRKRNDARNVILPDAETVLALLPVWIDDYINSHLHSGLGYCLPIEFRALPECA